jgi:hypothetical protein
MQTLSPVNLNFAKQEAALEIQLSCSKKGNNFDGLSVRACPHIEGFVT